MRNTLKFSVYHIFKIQIPMDTIDGSEAKGSFPIESRNACQMVPYNVEINRSFLMLITWLNAWCNIIALFYIDWSLILAMPMLTTLTYAFSFRPLWIFKLFVLARFLLWHLCCMKYPNPK